MSDRDHHGHGHGNDGDGALADLLDLDAAVLHEYWADVLGWVRREAGDGPRRRLVDLGAGTGTGTLGLAHRFGGAEVVAVDSSEEMLARIRAKALDQGLADRVHTVHADLDDAWPVPGPIDVTWASLSLHHLADPDRVLRDLLAATGPGGLVAIAEFAERPRYLPDSVGDGLEERLLAVITREQATQLPELGSDWTARLTKAGFALVEERTFDLDITSGADLGRYADLWFRRLRPRLAEHLSPADAALLDRLLDGDGSDTLLRRTDLHMRGTRTVTLARRP